MFMQIDQNILKHPEQNNFWYRDAENGCDLFLWLDQHDQIQHFQLWHEEYLVEWDFRQGLKSGQLDPNEGSFHNLQARSYHYHRTYLSEPLHKILHIIESAHNTEIEGKLVFIRQILKYFADKH